MRYETVFVDVGYLDKGKDVISSIGPPVYYATPTILIVDPTSGRLVNAENRHQWGNAYNISMQVPRDLDARRAEALLRVSSGEIDFTLDYPEYPAFSWETVD